MFTLEFISVFLVGLIQKLAQALTDAGVTAVVDQWEVAFVGFLKANAPQVLEWIEWVFSEKHQYVDELELPGLHWFYMLLVVAFYLTAVVVLRVVMTQFPAFECRGVALVYNVFETLLSLYMCVEALAQSTKIGYSWFGNYPQNGPQEHGLAMVVYIFTMNKVVEHMDTYLILFRKAHRQLSFLHVYHHVSIYVIWIIVCYSMPTAEAYWSTAANSGIHFMLYGYYATTLMFNKDTKIGAFVRKHKAKLTILQLIQFLTMLFQSVYCLYWIRVTEARWLLEILLYYMFTMLVLFGNFFIKLKSKGKKSNKPKAE